MNNIFYVTHKNHNAHYSTITHKYQRPTPIYFYLELYYYVIFMYNFYQT